VDAAQLGSWLQIVANVGLIVGLILVGFQISQSNTIAMANLAAVSYQETSDRILAEMGENPASVWAKAIMEPENLTPEEILVTRTFARWQITRMQRDALMEEMGLYSDGGWRSQLAPTGKSIGELPVAREYLLNFYQDDSRWWIKELQAAAEKAPKWGYKEFIEHYQTIAESYSLPQL